MKKAFALLLSACALSSLVACSASNEAADVTVTPSPSGSQTVELPPPVLPITETADITSSFVEKEITFDSESSMELSSGSMDTDSFAQADELVRISAGGTQKMMLHCTWALPDKAIYIGFANTSSDEIYTLSAVGGYLIGELDLSALPEAEYQVIMYCSDNENFCGAMQYQFL